MTGRVRDRATFEALGRARRHRRGVVTLRCVRLGDDRDDPPRVALAVSRPDGGTAVSRNRLRRRLRAAVRSHEAELAAGRAYLFTADAAALRVSFDELDASVGELIQRVGREGQ